MFPNLGHYNTSGTFTTVSIPFGTFDSAGANVAPNSAFEAADIRIYRKAHNGAISATQRSSSNGVTMTSPFDSLTGFHVVDIDLTDNTDSGFYADGYEYYVVLSPDETIDTQTVTGITLGKFTIGIHNVNVVQISGDAAAADNLETAADGGSYNLGGGGVVAASVTGNVGGNVTGTIGGLTAAALKDFFDTDSTTTYASAVAGSVVKEIADNAGGSSLTLGDIADAVWDEAQSGHTTGGTFGKYLDTEVSSRLASGGYSAPPSAATIAAAVRDVDNTSPAGSSFGAVANAVKAKTDQLTFTVANQVDSNVTNWKGSTAPAMTGDAFARLGAPAGASVSADIAAVNSKTTNLPADPADASDIAAALNTLTGVVQSPYYEFELTPAFTSTAGTTLRLIGLVKRGGQRVDVYGADATATCALAVREHGSGSDLFTITATTVNANGTFELSQASPAFTADRVYRYTATVVISGDTYTFEDAFPVHG